MLQRTAPKNYKAMPWSPSSSTTPPPGRWNLDNSRHLSAPRSGPLRRRRSDAPAWAPAKVHSLQQAAQHNGKQGHHFFHGTNFSSLGWCTIFRAWLACTLAGRSAHHSCPLPAPAHSSHNDCPAFVCPCGRGQHSRVEHPCAKDNLAKFEFLQTEKQAWCIQWSSSLQTSTSNPNKCHASQVL